MSSPMEAESSSRNLLQRFAGLSTASGDPPPPSTPAAELSLGLSLGGCFSSNPRERTNFLIRSSSISSFPNMISSIVKEDEDLSSGASLRVGTAVAQLKRTCSMPVPGVEDYRKRKVLQTLKRLEAKKKRNEKRMIGGGGGGLPPLSQGASGGSTSSSDRGSMQGPESAPSKKLERRVSGAGELEMPCVSTRGGGPLGRRIEGFLYKYRKGEEVRIVCVCHGNFLTPAEFVRHAGGGGDVEHPMRHIVINTPPPPSPFL